MSDACSSAQITGVAIFQNGRTLANRNRQLIFDAAFWLTDESSESGKKHLIGAVRYYNGLDLAFGDGEAFFVQAKIARFERDSAIERNQVHEDFQVALEDYDFVADAVFVIPAPQPTTGVLPYVQVSGLAQNVNDAAATWQVDANQFVTANAGSNGDRRRRVSVFPIDCVVPDSPLYAPKMPKEGAGSSKVIQGKKKPIPQAGKYIVAYGFVTGVSQDGDSKRFSVEVKEAAFLGRSALPGASPASSCASPLKRKGTLFDFSAGSPAPKQVKRSDPASGSQMGAMD